MQLPVEWLPESGHPEQLVVLLHGAGGRAVDLLPLAQALRAEFPRAAVLVPDAPQPWAGGDGGIDAGRQWFAIDGLTDASRAERVAATLPALLQWLRATQQRLGVGAAATALGGFSQGAILALETALAADGLVGRVLAFSGRFVAPPAQAPRHTTVHLFHGGADTVLPARHAREALEWLGTLRGDATLDIAEGVGHELHPVLMQRLLYRLRNHIPARTWAAALGGVPGLPDTLPAPSPNLLPDPLRDPLRDPPADE